MKIRRILFRGRISLSFFGKHVKQNRFFHDLHIAECGDEMIETMPLDGTEIIKIECLKQNAGCKETLERVFRSLGKLVHVVTDPGE